MHVFLKFEQEKKTSDGMTDQRQRCLRTCLFECGENVLGTTLANISQHSQIELPEHPRWERDGVRPAEIPKAKEKIE